MLTNRQILYEQLLRELTEYRSMGVSLKLDGTSSSPEEIAAAHLVCESSSVYMRDYISSPKDHVICELHFDRIKPQ